MKSLPTKQIGQSRYMPFLGSLVIGLSFSLCLTSMGQANQERTLTASDGRTIHARLISKTDSTVAIIRTEDSKRFILPLDKLSAADQSFIKAWEPTQSRNQASNSSSEKKWGATLGESRPYYGPAYRSGGSSGRSYSQTNSGGSNGGGCRLVRRTVTVIPGCPK